MKKRYKKLAAGGMIFLAVSVSIIGALPICAYFIDRGQRLNSFTVGENTIIPEEPFEPPAPGEKTVKEPKAVNTGQTDCYVRAKVMLSDSRIEPYLTYISDNVKAESLWSEASDGWLYYDRILGISEETEPVFTHIVLDNEIPAEYGDFTIDVVFESVQAEGFADAKRAFSAIAGIPSEAEKLL